MMTMTMTFESLNADDREMWFDTKEEALEEANDWKWDTLTLTDDETMQSLYWEGNRTF